MFNVTRSQPAPVSLLAQSKYDSDDVWKALKDIFFDKCYLCETKEPHSINVEHFNAHLGNSVKKFDWNNLYYVCARCNNIKLASYSNLLDCANPAQDVLRAVKLLPPRTPGGRVEVAAMAGTASAVETAKLLDEIYNSDKSANKRLSGVYLRKNIFKKVTRFLRQVVIYFDDESPPVEKSAAFACLRTFMGTDQEYSAFLRWVVLEDESLEPLLRGDIP